jgi:hypothetical protein
VFAPDSPLPSDHEARPDEKVSEHRPSVPFDGRGLQVTIDNSPATLQTGRKRTRTHSRERGRGNDTITVPADWFMRSVQSSGARSISDTVVAPKPFTGSSTQDPEAWLEYFERYVNFRKLSTAERLELLGMLMHEGAANWLSTLPETDRRDYACLVEGFQDQLFQIAGIKMEGRRSPLDANPRPQ